MSKVEDSRGDAHRGEKFVKWNQFVNILNHTMITMSDQEHGLKWSENKSFFYTLKFGNEARMLEDQSGGRQFGNLKIRLKQENFFI